MVVSRGQIARGSQAVGRAVVRGAAALRPHARDRAPWERSVLDDIAVRRPWNVVVKAARMRAMLRSRRLADGTTVVIVNWNTREVLADVLRAAQHFSPPGTRLLVVDNASSDGSREMLRSWPDIATLLLRSNAGHGVALDLALLTSATTITVTLDSDAIPLREDWLEAVVRPVRDGHALLAGLRSSRDFVHPVFSAVQTRSFVRRGLSFQVHRRSGVTNEQSVWGENAWDTGELLTQRLDPTEVAFVEPTENPAPGLPGMTAGGVVYHHGGVSRAAAGVTVDALAEWRGACEALGLAAIVGARR